MVKNPLAGDTVSIPGLEISPGKGNGNIPVFLPEKPHGQGNLVDSMGSQKSQT